MLFSPQLLCNPLFLLSSHFTFLVSVVATDWFPYYNELTYKDFGLGASSKREQVLKDILGSELGSGKNSDLEEMKLKRKTSCGKANFPSGQFLFVFGVGSASTGSNI